MANINRMKIIHFIGFPLLVLFCLTAGFASSQGSDNVNKQIEVRISPQSKVVRVGEPLEVRVEVWNVGSEQLFIEKDIYAPCADSSLSFRIDSAPPLGRRDLELAVLLTAQTIRKIALQAIW